MNRNLPPIFFFCWLGFAGQCFAAPACYEDAKIPAHEFVFQKPSTLDEITALAPDGNSCVQVKFWKGEPLIRQKLFMPFGKLYEAYARAIENRDVHAARKLFAYGRPTPRNFELFLPLYVTPPGHPMPWGKAMFKKILRVLQPYEKFGDDVLYNFNPGSEGTEWSALFFLMGGELYPDGKWITGSKWPSVLCYFLPSSWIEKSDGKIRLNQ